MAQSSGSSRGGSRSSGGRRSSGSGKSGGRSSSAKASGSRSASSRGSSSRSASSRSSSSRSSGARKSTARKSTARSSSSSSRSSSARSGGQTKRRAAAKKGGQARARQQKAQKAARAATPGGAEFSGKSVAELRDALAKGVVAPLNLVMLSRDRIEDALDDAVKRGRMTRDDAQDLVQGLLERGRKQTNDVLSDLEQLLGRGGEIVGTARQRGATAAKRSRTRVRSAVDPALATADRARRAAGVGPSFPVLGYDDLTAAQVQGRLEGLTAAELRKVRDYERRNANRKSVLDAVESKLS